MAKHKRQKPRGKSNAARPRVAKPKDLTSPRAADPLQGDGDGYGDRVQLRSFVQAPAEIDVTDAQLDGSGDTPAAEFSVVAVGASAGGLEAFKQLLSSLPTDPGMALVFIQHLSPAHESVLPELLTPVTKMPVVQVREAMRVEPNRVHVIPPNFHMSLASDGTFHLVPRPTDRTQHMPIDAFFRSLAEHAGQHAIGIVLSGTSSDGSLGLREIKAVGGITLAQEPKTAKYDGMPRAAIATGAIDMILPPKEIAQELTRIIRHPFVRHVRPRQHSDSLLLLDVQLHRIFALLRATTGVDFTHYKQPTIRRRLQRRMILHKITSVDHYIKFLQQQPDEIRALYSDILIHVTRFFREPESFTALAEVVYPAILSQRLGRSNNDHEDPIRIWVPGCATGEEPYSIAIALLEFLGEDGANIPVQVFATDISDAAIDFARAGVYPDNITEDVSPERLRRFFTRSDGGYRISKTVRDLCVFARQDITRDPPFSKLNLIVCRNVLIYLGPILQKRIMTVFHYALKPTGFLMLGAAETVGSSADLFSVTDKKHRLYTKKTGGPRAEVSFAPMDHPGRAERGTPRHAAPHRPAAGIQHEANRVLLERFSPPGVLVNDDLQIIQFRGQTGRFLEPAPGEASLNVLKMAREGLLYGLRTAIGEARRAAAPARRDGLRVKYNGEILDAGVEVIPLDASSEDRHFLIVFHDQSTRGDRTSEVAVGDRTRERRASKKDKKDAKAKSSTVGDQRILRLQEELAASREYLQSIIQDLEAANEELQSANEEILSSNEELQSTNEELDTAKEELQSTNEELNTVNEELHTRNEELSRVNSDLVNLLASVQIAIVMVASDLRIRRFTPAAEKVLNLIPTDIGRPISDIKPNIDCPDLERMIAESIDRVTTVEREVADRQGKTFLLRIRPYKSIENRIDGAVLALFDVDGPGDRPEGSAATDGSNDG
jgi:two-component system CheB/CheR fusion protein